VVNISVLIGNVVIHPGARTHQVIELHAGVLLAIDGQPQLDGPAQGDNQQPAAKQSDDGCKNPGVNIRAQANNYYCERQYHGHDAQVQPFVEGFQVGFQLLRRRSQHELGQGRVPLARPLPAKEPVQEQDHRTEGKQGKHQVDQHERFPFSNSS
jgi:hypothetical protein